MSPPANPYRQPAAVDTCEENDNESMHDASPTSSKDSDFEGKHTADDEAHDTEAQGESNPPPDEEEINFEESTFQIPPSFSRPITEETLRDSDHPYVFWATLRLPIPVTPVNPMAAVFDALEEFVTTMAEEDSHFVVFPHNLSDFEEVDDLPIPIIFSTDQASHFGWRHLHLGFNRPQHSLP